MKWCCFLFWFIYRLVLACLAHFNWCLAVYTNCIYFSLWKSYDLLWFWMHLMLCTCFPPLRRENYLIVWSNLIWKRYRFYPNLTYKQLYLVLYGGKGTKAERALKRMDTMETKERESRRLRRITEGSSSSSDEEDEIVAADVVEPPKLSPHSVPTLIAQEEEECRKFAYVGQAVDSQQDLEPNSSTNRIPVPPPRPSRSPVPTPSSSQSDSGGKSNNGNPTVNFNLEESEGGAGNVGDAANDRCSSEDDSDTNSTSKWIQKVPEVIRNKFKKKKKNNSPPRVSSGHLSLMDDTEDTASISTWNRIRGMVPNPLKFNRSVSNSGNPNEMDVLTPTYTNTHDIRDPKKAEKRAKHDKKALTARVRKRVREELKEEDRKEKKRRMITDAIELLLQLLRMMTSFAVLVGNIRKTFIPAQFKYLKPGQHAYDNYELLLLFRMTTFLDVAMFWTSVMWVYCLQWHLCCRLGIVRFWAWAALLAVVAMIVMIIPMSYAMNEMDLSWCRFMTNSTLERYQPTW